MLLCPVGAGNEEGGHPPGRSCLKPWCTWNIVAMKTLNHHMWHDRPTDFGSVKNLFKVFLLAPSHHLQCLARVPVWPGYLSFLDFFADSNRSGLHECILPQTNWWPSPSRFLIVTTTEQLISKRGGKMASHACPPHLRKLLSAHFVFQIWAKISKSGRWRKSFVCENFFKIGLELIL